jgi:glycosyltransferase involved in cell wall biosynthesis
MSRNEKSTITVLLPINNERFLNQTLKSINQQSMSGDQINLLAVVDRGVQKQKIQSMLRSQITEMPWEVIETAETGIVGTLNTGLKHSSTEYIARIDEDDLMFHNRLKIQFDYLEKNRDVLCVGGQIELIDERGVHLGFSYFPKSQWLIAKTIGITTPMAHPSVMYRRSEVVQLGGYRKNLPEDWDLWLRLHEAGKISNLKQVIVKYRIHPHQLSRTKLYQTETARQLLGISRTLRSKGAIDEPQDNQTTRLWIQQNKELLSYEKIQDKLKVKLWVYIKQANSLLLRVHQKSQKGTN